MSEAPIGLSARANLALIGAPVYWWQGRRVRRETPRLPEAPGPRHGRVEGDRPALNLVGVGESPLAGVGVETPTDTVTAQLAAGMAAGTRRAVEWSIHARGGITAAETTHELVPDITPGTVDVALIALGVNDCLKLRSARRWRRDLTGLIQALDERIDPRVILLAGVPPMQHFPALPGPLAGMLGLRARLLEAVSARIAAQRTNLALVPMEFDGDSEEMFCHDGFHPSAAGHRRWGRQLAPIAIELLERVNFGPESDRNSDPAR
ncbi:MAG: SGNH/GDSL hydrolase family protein [Wenzhouxiangella sp.]